MVRIPEQRLKPRCPGHPVAGISAAWAVPGCHDGSMDVEVLHIADCPHLDAAIDLLHRTLTDLGMPGQPIRTTVITDDGHARERNFPGSPTFLIDGVDPFRQQSQPAALACRLYHTSTGRRPVPDATDLRRALDAAARPGCR